MMRQPNQGSKLPGPADLWLWMRTNLFATWFDTLTTILLTMLLVSVLPPIIDWSIVNATFIGETRDACQGSGACWVFIGARFNQFIYGFYPSSEYWRPNLVGLIFFLGLAYLFGPSRWRKKELIWSMLTVFPVISYFCLAGGFWGLAKVEMSLWGGLLLTLIVATVGIVVSFPFGILLAIGRRSEWPLMRYMSVSYIEFWRGVPLITVLFMASVMIPFFLPSDWQINKLLRVLVGVSLFASAYMAEVVRGGLQAIDKGQDEAGIALGLGYWQRLRFVILPQALKHVIPGIVNTFIGLFKDTTLVLIVGMFDLLGIVQAAATDPDWIGFAMEGYLFAGFVFWIFCFGMSRYSLRLEKKLTPTR